MKKLRFSVCGIILCVLAAPLLSVADTVPALNTLYNFTPADNVTLLGAHFDGITSITFGGVPATRYSYVTSDDTAINVIVPPGATSGPIVVTNPGGSAASQTFHVVRRGR